jgi:hypothetical protein
MAMPRTFTRQETDANGDLISLNNRTSVHLIPGKAVVLKEGNRIIAYYDRWKEQAKLEYIRDTFIGILKNPRNAPAADWSLLDA